MELPDIKNAFDYENNFYLTCNIKLRGMARADEFIFLGHPGHCASQVRTGARQGQKTTVRQPGQVEFAPNKSGHRAGQEVAHRPDNDYRIQVRCTYPWFTGL